ncbi:YciI family protein [Kibdelosporangium philippinense]|uniref:YciI family protein n=1 Tax=Kibdelosporangium philippinense TaxID=211113 RepID=A0ABS8Z0Z0_9PSEU|nr:YciI family protein [Kibdelosporangium philippinense]MCE7001619.1 YciI family protein [Kibdelosporangium philippinense]
MSQAKMLWSDLVKYGEEQGLLGKQLFIVFSNPTNGIGPILENLDTHVEYQRKLERDGIMFAAGPLANHDLTEWDGEGIFMYRANSMAAAVELAAADPMHISGARSYTVRLWLLNEGTYSVQVYYSGGKPKIE